MQNMIQELLYQHEGKKNCCLSQGKKIKNGIATAYKEGNKQLPKTVPATEQGIKSAGDIGVVVGGGNSFGGFKSPLSLLKRITEGTETTA